MYEPASLNRRIPRLSRLVGTDPGFYLLALHAFIERHVKDGYPQLNHIESFPDLLWAFGDELKRCGRPSVDDLRTLVRIAKEHYITNRVRHDFEEIDIEEARGATHNFLRFCAVCRIEHAGLARFASYLDEWNDRTSPIEQSEAL